MEAKVGSAGGASGGGAGGGAWPPGSGGSGGSAAPPVTDMIRPPLAAFVIEMERKLKKNDHKKGWRELPVEALERLMMIEIEEFKVARDFFEPEDARKELVDIANFAMMLYDRMGHGK